MPKAVDPRNNVASVEKAIGLLELFGEGEPVLSLANLIARGGHTRTTTYRLLGTLERVGWVARTAEGYQLTLKVFRLGTSAANALQLRKIALPVLAELAAKGGETVYLIVPDGPRGVCLERVEGASLVKLMVLDVGKSLPLHVGGGPLALLAHRDDLLADVLAAEPLVTPSGMRLPRAELLDMLQSIRDRGYSRSAGDVTSGVGAFGAPVFNTHGVVVAAVSIGGLLPILIENEAHLSLALCDAATRISAQLGYRNELLGPRP
jgi:DNA-binding IclR family transcriptional regulator